MLDLKNAKHIHCIGIGGIGLSAIADILVARGYKVTGSDMNQNEITQKLEKKGIKVFYGHEASNINGADIIVFSAAISPENPELKKALEEKSDPGWLHLDFTDGWIRVVAATTYRSWELFVCLPLPSNR